MSVAETSPPASEPDVRDKRLGAGNREASSKRISALFAVAVLTLLAAAVRLRPLFHSFWYDELWTLRFMRSGPLYALTHQEGYNNHPLNSLLGCLTLRLWNAFTGQNFAHTLPPSWLIRLPSFVLGIAAVPMLYATVVQRLDRRIALVSALLLCLSPTAVDFSAQSRGYAALLFFTIAQTWCLARAFRSNRLRDWLLWLVCAVLGTLAHLYFLFVFAADALCLLALIAAKLWSVHASKPSVANAPTPGTDHNAGPALRLLANGVLAGVCWAALVYVAYRPMLPVLRAMQAQFVGKEPVALTHQLLLPTLQQWGGLPRGNLMYVYDACLIVFSFFGLIFLIRRRSGVALFLILLLALPPIITEIQRPHYLYMRFFSFLLPAFLTLLACGMAQIALSTISAKSQANRNIALAVLSTAFLALTLPGLRDVICLPKQDFQGAADYMRPLIGKGEPIGLLGIGSEWFGAYGIRGDDVNSLKNLRARLAGHASILILDANMTPHPHQKTPYYRWIHNILRHPLWVFPGRYSGWKYLYYDGDSDITLYRLNASDLPPPPAETKSPSHAEL